MKIAKIVLLLGLTLPLFALTQNLPNAPSAQQAKLSNLNTDTGWPRTVKDGAREFVIHQPQVDRVEGTQVFLYSAIAMKAAAKEAPNYGVVWFHARTEVDKVNRLVTLDSAQVTKVDFPAAHGEESGVLELLNKRLPGKTKMISLDRYEAMVRTAAPQIEGVKVNNSPPKIIIATKPSLLVTVDGAPKLVPVEGTNLQRLVNTSAMLFFAPAEKKYYLRVMDWWLEAEQLEGPWKYPSALPAEMESAEKYLARNPDSQGPQGLNASGSQGSGAPVAQQPSLKAGGKEGNVPAVYVAFTPTEMVETKGEPRFIRVPGTRLEYVENTSGSIFRLAGEHYILISGRWFRSTALGGEWSFVETLPDDFKKIPKDGRKAGVLASVPGTPQAEEGVIANSIPQTATITRSEAKLAVHYDGKPAFVPIEGTSMAYARNTSVPVIRVGELYFAVEAGVWFTAPTPEGPWRVAEKVPAEIYSIPASSPMHYVTYAKVYGSTPEVVYVGYTPGYYGTVVSESTKTVVYGTGWYYPPYIGPTVWYGYPYTYGVGASFTWADESGWSFGFGYSYSYYPYYYPWWGPLGYYGYGWYPYYGGGAWGGAATANVYGRWGNAAYSRTAAAWANPYTGNYGAGSRGVSQNTATGRVMAGGRGYNTNIYTGNTAGFRGAAVYDPSSGIVAGAGAGFAGNRYTGSGTGGRGGFVYDTNRTAGIAAGKDNLYAGKDGTVYRYNRQSGNWSQNSGNGWQAANKPGNAFTPALQRQQEARNTGAQRWQNFNSMHGSRSMSAPMRMGGRRR